MHRWLQLWSSNMSVLIVSVLASVPNKHVLSHLENVIRNNHDYGCGCV